MPRLLRRLVDWTVGGLSRWRYQIEKGSPHLTLFMGLLGVIAGLIVGGGIVLWLAGDVATPTAGMWWVFLHLSDPGYLGGDEGPLQTTLGTLLTVLGIVVFTSGVIAIITNLLAAYLERLAQGGHDIAFADHVVIIGWSDRVPALVFELLEADHHNEVAILADLPKADADAILDRRVFSGFRSQMSLAHRAMWWRDPRRNVIYRQGNPLVEADLKRVGTRKASRFILLAPADDRGVDVDVRMMRTWLVVQDHRSHGDQADKAVSCVIEITENRLREHVFLAAGLDPRLDPWVAFELAQGGDERGAVPDPDMKAWASPQDLTLVNSDELISRALVQCAVQPRLSAVHDELLSFAGRDFYVLDGNELAQHFSGRKGAEARRRWQALVSAVAHPELPPGQVHAEIGRHLENGLILGGLERNERGAVNLLLDPAQWRQRLPSGDPGGDNDALALIVLGEGSGRGRLGGHAPLRVRSPPLPRPQGGRRVRVSADHQGTYRVLVLGQNRRLGVLIEQFAQYTEQYAGLDLAVTLVDADLPEDVRTLLPHDHGHWFCEQSTEAVRKDFSHWHVMRDLLAHGPEAGPAYDSIVLLGEDHESDGAGVDARVVLGLVMLRAFRADARTSARLTGTSVVAEILDPDNRRLFLNDDWVTDVIVTNRYVSRFTAQVAHDARVEGLYREILDFGGGEIYLRPLADYELTSQAPTFLDASAVVGSAGEIALGFMSTDADGRVRPVLAPEPSTPLGAATDLLVLAQE